MAPTFIKCSQRQMKMKNIFFFAFPMLFLGACNNSEKAYDATGIFEATEITVSAQASGEVLQLDITEGQSLEAGAQVGQIDSYQLVQKLGELEAAKQQIYANDAATESRQLDLNKQLATLQQQIVHAQRERQRFAEQCPVSNWMTSMIKSRSCNVRWQPPVISCAATMLPLQSRVRGCKLR